MPFIDPGDMTSGEPLPGWRGRYWRSETMGFAWYDIDAGSSIHEHHHPHEEVWIVVDGELEVSVDGRWQTAGPGAVVVVPPDAKHAVRAKTAGRALVANHPVREDFDTNPR